ncbi:hypothetical protein [Streptomyces sp. NPDC086782]|uniref:hypothetical protein n=1 Tax=Streptomyces sp. NPDC086782 TaxID=3365757 RepID=UPI00381203FF
MNARAIDILTNLAGNRIEQEEKARKALADEAGDMAKGLGRSTIRKAMEAVADAMPYRLLMEDQESDSPAEAFLQLHKSLTR